MFLEPLLKRSQLDFEDNLDDEDCRPTKEVQEAQANCNRYSEMINVNFISLMELSVPSCVVLANTLNCFNSRLGK